MTTDSAGTLEPETPQAIMEMASGFMRSRAFLTACELDLFTMIGDGEKGSSEVARDLGTDSRATDRLMNVLSVLGLLRKRDHRFRNSPSAARYLARTSPEYIGGLMHWVHLWDTWSTLTPAVRRGTSATGPVNDREDTWLRAFIAAMHWRARQHAPAVIAGLDLARVSRVLDVGGGSGAYAVAFVQANPRISATVFDLPNVLPLTADYVREAGVGDRVTLIAGDYDTDDLGRGFDLVFLSAIVHSNSPEANQNLVRKAVAALDTTGQVVVQDFIVDEDRTGPPFGVLFALNMLVGTGAGDTYTEAEVRAWMEDAGLCSIGRRDMPFGTSVMVGWRRPAG